MSDPVEEKRLALAQRIADNQVVYAKRQHALVDLCVSLGIDGSWATVLMNGTIERDLQHIHQTIGLAGLLEQAEAIACRFQGQPLGPIFCQRCASEEDVQMFVHGTWCASCRQEWLDRPSRPSPRAYANAIGAARRARLPATLTPKQWAATVEHFADRCAYCGGAWFVIEHATSTRLGSGTTWGNCLPACADCNRKKGARTLEELRSNEFPPGRLEAARAWLIQHGR